MNPDYDTIEDRMQEPPDADEADSDMTWFLLTKPRPKIIGKTCQQTEFVCKRPWWGNDGRVNGEFHGLCPLCWHAWNAWHGKYVTLQANPASMLNTGNVGALRFLTGNELPDIGAERPDTFPEEWTKS